MTLISLNPSTLLFFLHWNAPGEVSSEIGGWNRTAFRKKFAQKILDPFWKKLSTTLICMGLWKTISRNVVFAHFHPKHLHTIDYSRRPKKDIWSKNPHWFWQLFVSIIVFYALSGDHLNFSGEDRNEECVEVVFIENYDYSFPIISEDTDYSVNITAQELFDKAGRATTRSRRSCYCFCWRLKDLLLFVIK